MMSDVDDLIECDDTDDDEPGYCPQCSGSGEGMYDASRCHVWGGSGVELKDDGREDWEADRAEQRNDARNVLDPFLDARSHGRILRVDLLTS
jgi:hypothetical protein